MKTMLLSEKELAEIKEVTLELTFILNPTEVITDCSGTCNGACSMGCTSSCTCRCTGYLD